MKYLTYTIIALVLTGCNLGHPVKTTDKVAESDLIGTFEYRSDYVIELMESGKGAQLIDGNRHPFTWSLSNNEITISDLIGNENRRTVKFGKQVYIISKDYRDYYYPFGSPYDFDNHEVWNKVE